MIAIAYDLEFGISLFARVDGRLHKWRDISGTNPQNHSCMRDSYWGNESGTKPFKIHSVVRKSEGESISGKTST